MIRIQTFILIQFLVQFAKGQFCTTLSSNTWAGFVQAVKESYDYGLAYLCPFKISGDGCPSPGDYPDGLVVDGSESFFLSCDPFLYGYNTKSECVIDCPGSHFTIKESSKLTLMSFTLSGATNSSIKVETGGSLKVINSILMDNSANSGNGGAINGLPSSDIRIEYSQLLRNSATLGGALYASQQSTSLLIESDFKNNQATQAVSVLKKQLSFFFLICNLL